MEQDESQTNSMSEGSSVTNNCKLLNNSDSVPSVHSIATLILDAPPSCIEFCRLAPDICIVGTYALEHETKNESGAAQERSGSLQVFRWDEEKLSLLQKQSVGSAVLDLHFSPSKPSHFAIATSTGTIEIFQLHFKDAVLVAQLQVIQLFEPSILVLSLAWCPETSAMDKSLLAASASDGKIVVVEFDLENVIAKVLHRHSQEAWTVAWTVMNPSGYTFWVYSGGDDSGLQASELVMLKNKPQPGWVAIRDQALLSDRSDSFNSEDDLDENLDDGKRYVEQANPNPNLKIHTAGVTAILPLTSEGSRTLLTGSYDEHVRVLALSPNGQWINKAEKSLGGGVWRLKEVVRSEKRLSDAVQWVRRFWILASCMHAGARLVEVSVSIDGVWTINVTHQFEEHESMNYGSDATTLERGRNCVKRMILASTSFYDKKLCLWSVLRDHSLVDKTQVGPYQTW